MARYIFRSVLDRIPVFFGITILSFAILHLPPGEPTDMQTQMNPRATAEVRERLRSFYGLDRPIHIQYLDWIGKLARLDFGESFSSDHRPVLDKIAERLPITIGISFATMTIIFFLSIPFGLIMALKPRLFITRLINTIALVGYSTPSFALSLYLIIIFGVTLSWMPITGIHSIHYSYMSPLGKIQDLSLHLILPISAMVLHSIAFNSWLLKGAFLENYHQDFVTTARAKGLPEQRVIVHHALRNALLPYITILGLSLPALIGGSIIIETIFAIPGMGLLFYTSIMARDYPVVMGILVIGAVLTLLGNLFADLGYALADPRIRTR